MKRIVLVTGGFDPLHSGHIEYLNAAKKLGDELWVGVNSDTWLTRKKSKPFMPAIDRLQIIKNLKMVDNVISFNDNDDTANDAIKRVLESHSGRQKRLSDEDVQIIFANGGDRYPSNTPEQKEYHNNTKVTFKFGVGGAKINSSSWIIEDHKYPRSDRIWGYYRVLYGIGSTLKLKELTVDPGKSLSMQRHKHRAEYWYVAEGTATVNTLDKNNEETALAELHENETITIDKGRWHQLVNNNAKPLKIIEIQYGENCVEEDIERK